MKKIKKLKVGLLIIGLFFTLALISIQFSRMNVSINDGTIGKKDITPNLSAGKSASVEWYRTWGGAGPDSSFGVAVDLSGNVYLTGITANFGKGNDDMVLVKYDENGIQQWNRTWGGTGPEGSYGVVTDSLGYIYVTGRTFSFGVGNSNMVLVKYDGNGTQQWNRTWGGSGAANGHGIAIDSSDNIYIAGETFNFSVGDSNMVLVKYDGNGTQLWNRMWGGNDSDSGLGVTVDPFDNVYLMGTTWSLGAGSGDIVLVKYDKNGMQQWNRTWGGVYIDYGNGVTVDLLGNVYLVGFTLSFGSESYDIVLVKYDDNGAQQWNRTWGGGDDDYGYGVAMDSSGNVYLAGYTESFGAGGYDMVLVKYDGNGGQQWNHIWGGNNTDVGYGVVMDLSSNIYLAGWTASFGVGSLDMVLIKYSVEEEVFILGCPIELLTILSLVGIISILIYLWKKEVIT